MICLGSGRNGGKPRFATISSRTEIPDQDELNQVDEGALKTGHQTITVDKDNEVLTEVIDGECTLGGLYDFTVTRFLYKSFCCGPTHF
jgi:hypothetical protein